jgi:carbohydrate kinase (thermoresistant glucokinase family)
MCEGAPVRAARIVVMGVSGVGKTTVGRLVAARVDAPFLDADTFHRADAIEKMHAGHALTDADRAPWLQRVHVALLDLGDGPVVLACSALKRSYRDVLRDGLAPLVFVVLELDPAALRSRLAARTDHFAGPSLLASQLATLELGDDVVRVDASGTADVVADAVVAAVAAVDDTTG